VAIGVMLRRFLSMVNRVMSVSSRDLRMMRRFLVIVVLMMFRRFAMVLRSKFVMFRRSEMMLGALMIGHFFFSSSLNSTSHITKRLQNSWASPKA
jgi:hypothetical protein